MQSTIQNTIHVPCPEDTVLAKQAASQLVTKSDLRELYISFQTEQGDQELKLPVIAIELLTEILRMFAQGQAVQLRYHPPRMSLGAAANILNTTQGFVEKLIEQGELPVISSETIRLIPLQDLLDYQRQFKQKQFDAMNELTALSEEMGLYDPPFDNPMIK